MTSSADSVGRLDCLLVHTPKMNNFYKPLGEFMWINYMPMGLLAIADWVNRHGHPTRIVHCGIEWIENPDFAVEDYVRRHPALVIGLTLQWHQQSYDVIETARRIKAVAPESYIVLGGFTASFFHEELVRDYDCVDGVIRGDGEAPLLELVEQITSGKRDLAKIRNLTWRRNGNVVVNPLNYVGTRELVNQLCFTNLPLLEHYETYIRCISLPFVYAKNESRKANFWKYTIRSPMFPLCIGRGCPVDCSYCGGSRSAQRLINGRDNYFYRSIDKVIESVVEAQRYGYETMHTAYDPEPRMQKYYARLWREIRRREVRVEWFFEANALPSHEMIDEFALTFPSPRSVIAVSPETGSERVRFANRGFYFSNAELMSTLGYMDKKGISIEVFFTYGIPFETEADIQETVKLRREIARRFKHVTGMRALGIELEPGAPWQRDPERFGIRTSLRTFRDFYVAHSDGTQGTYTRLGYYNPHYFADGEVDEKTFAQRIQAIKCRHLCFIHPNTRRYGKPWQGRLLCRVASLANKLRRPRRKHATG